ncbi:MAG TPA: tryptophan synthase subunit alpha [Tepidisphaeraceae bacterium]|nr:tryptophan synthase subunit alpha [Tepidisphaeraceae bacterium]
MSQLRDAGRKSVRQAFAEVRGSGRIGLVPFIPAGYPNLQTTRLAISALDAAGATAIEVGFPFSDPVADGPTIQQAYTAALAAKITVANILATIAAVSGTVRAPLVGMASYSIIYRQGSEKFFAAARAAGISGLIIPDLPPPEARSVCRQIAAAGLEVCLLVAPTTAPARRKEICDLCTGFVYYLSVSGITGQRADLPPDLADNLRELRTLTDKPICVGFGISRPEHVKSLRGLADGAIVGSAIVGRMNEYVGESPEKIAEVIGGYARELLAAG